ncbi:MAG: hypothetical protein JSW37_13235, partial [Anaerolineales bacterium]
EKYKDAEGIRMYGFSPLDLEELPPPGDPTVDDPLDATYPVEVLPYTDPWAPFNPQMEQAPWKDSLTFNPAYMNEFINSGEPLVELYRQISIREQNAYEKVFLRMWYEPEYLDKILVLDPLDTTPPFTETQVYTFPAVMQEFTYMYLDTRDRPASAQPKSSRFAFPMATAADELPAPDPATYNLPPNLLPSFGYGLTTFDGNFDGFPDAVQVNSERTLATRTGITADFDGDMVMDLLDTDGAPSSGDEMVIFALEDMVLQRGDSVQFLDHMVTLENISRDDATLRLWYTGGGLHAVGTEYSLHPDRIGSYRLQVAEMAIANHSQVRVLPAGGTNADGSWNADGAWFVFVDDIDSSGERVSLIVGRALGATHSAMDDGLGSHDELPGDPWYLKRFFVDGHEYNVVALHMVPATITNPGDEPYEFKYITIRTPVPKVNFINYEDSQKLEGYYRGLVFGEDSDVISVMPPFNSRHTAKEDVQTFPERAIPPTGCPDEPEAFVFANRTFYEPALWCPPNIVDPVCVGDVLKDKPPYQIRIVDEDRDPQFFGELKEKYNDKEVAPDELWQTEQFHMVPDQYTKLSLPEGQLYLLTSDWTSEQS